MLEFRVLGPLEVVEGDRPVALGSPKQRALLAMLLLHRGEVVSTERLIDELWVNGPPLRERLRAQLMLVLYRCGRQADALERYRRRTVQWPGMDGRDDVALTNLDQPLFDGARATKRDLVEYLEAVSEQLLGELRDRPLSVVRALRGQRPFMQKNVPKYTPPWVKTVTIWAERSKRDVAYALCNDWRTLLWFANQRAIEYHPTLARANSHGFVQTHLVLDLDPPAQTGFDSVARVAELVRRALADAGLAGAVKTSGAKGLHVFVPLAQPTSGEQIAAATRALAARAEGIDPRLATTAYVVEERGGKVFIDATRAGGATVVAAYSPRIRPDTPVSFPVSWDELERVAPTDFTIHTVPALLRGGNPWADQLPEPQSLPTDLIEEGRAIPVARVQAMHEGKRRARARRRRADS